MLKSEKQVVDPPLDLNRESVEELASIEGIEMARAHAIIVAGIDMDPKHQPNEGDVGRREFGRDG